MKYRTNSKHVRELVIKHIFECVTDQNEQPFDNFEDLQKFVIADFEDTANYRFNLQRYPNIRDRFSNYLSDLPSFSNFYYEDSDIINYLNSLGINPEGKKYPIEKSIKLYHYLIWREIFK